MRGNTPKAFSELTKELFRQRRKQPHLTVKLLRQHWEGILGAELARKTWPGRIAGDTLWIHTQDASWAFQLQFMKREMLEAVQVFMGTATIADLRFKQGDFPAVPDPPGPAQQETAAEAPPHKVEEIEPHPQTDAIPDPALRSSFGRWFSLNRRRKAAQGTGNTAKHNRTNGETC